MSQPSRTPRQPSQPEVVDIAASSSPPSRRPLTLPSTMRFPGDGFDFRRPVMSSPSGGGTGDVIDLTNEPDSSPSRFTERQQGSDSATPRRRRLPRFGREIMDVVDLEDDDDEEEGERSNPAISDTSPEVEFVGSTTRTLPVPSSGITAHASHLYRMLVSGQQSFARQIPWAGRLLRRPPQDVDTVWIGDGSDGGMGFSINLDMEYPRSASTPVHARPENTYKPPSPPPEGFTRSIGEDDVVVCPNCDEELGTGDEVKQQVFVVKNCGHVRLAKFIFSYRTLGLILILGLLWRMCQTPLFVESKTDRAKGKTFFEMQGSRMR